VTYHGNMQRTGSDLTEPSLDPISTAWTNTLDGSSVYGEPVVADGRVFVATEDDDVYALDAHDGHILWQAKIGQPLTNVSQATGCGDIDPLGITSTPVIDTSTATVYVVGETSNGASPPTVQHRLVGFDLYTGAETLNTSADPVLPAGESNIHLQQRPALALGNGRVYVGYGGLDGDCGLYHGWVVGVDETGSRPNIQFDATPQSSGGAIWGGGGGPSIDSEGAVYVTTGNPNGGGADPWAEAVVKLDANLDSPPLHVFQDSQATGDEDLSTGDPLLLPNGDVFTVGKTDIGYLLSQSKLTQVHAISGTVCGSDPDGGATYDAATNSIYVPCRDGASDGPNGRGIQQINLNTYSTGWQSGTVNGAPTLVDGDLWALNYFGDELEELNPSNGAEVQSVQVGSVPTFASPSAADGLLLFGTTDGIKAMDGPSGPPSPAPPAPPPTAGYWMAAADGGVFNFGTAGFYGSLGGIHLNAPIVGMAATRDGRGYWLVAADGGVFAFGDAHFYGSTGGVRLAQPVVGMAVDPAGTGYWLVARDGGVFAFGTARFDGSTGGVRLAKPVVGMAADRVTGGYWLVASDGGIFNFDAPFLGSTGGSPLTHPVVGISATTGGTGYWLVASDGGLFNFRAAFDGSASAVDLKAPIVGIAADADGSGYWLVGSDGGVYGYGAPFEGSTAAVSLTEPVVAVAPVSSPG
jgi:outer membrane protein assembly factor BamB